MSATAATAGDGASGGADPRQTVEVNLVLVDDAALGGVVGALGGLGSRILALRKSEPSLEDVFVELVGRGFDDADENGAGTGTGTGPAAAAGPRRPDWPATRRARAAASPSRRRSHDRPRVRRAPVRRARARPPTGAAAGSWSNDLRSVVGRAFPRVTRHAPRAVLAVLRDPAAVPDDVARSCSSTGRSQAPPEYIGFVVLGGAMTAFWLNVIWMMAAQLYWEKDQGNLELYFAAPMDVMSVLFGMAIGGLVMSATRAVVVLARRLARLRRPVLGRPVGPAAARLLPDPGRAVRAGHGPRQPVPDVGPRGVAPDPAHDRAGLLRVGAQLPGRRARAASARSRWPRSRWPSVSTRCASSPSPGAAACPAILPPEVEA